MLTVDGKNSLPNDGKIILPRTSRITKNDMLSLDGVLAGAGDHVVYKKKVIKGGRYLYAFRYAKKANAEEAAYLARREKNRDFTPEGYAKKKKRIWCHCF